MTAAVDGWIASLVIRLESQGLHRMLTEICLHSGVLPKRRNQCLILRLFLELLKRVLIFDLHQAAMGVGEWLAHLLQATLADLRV